MKNALKPLLNLSKANGVPQSLKERTMCKFIRRKGLPLLICVLIEFISLQAALGGSVSPAVTGGPGGAGGPSVTPIEGEYTPSLKLKSSTGLSVGLGEPAEITGPSPLTPFQVSGLVATSTKAEGGTTVTLENSSNVGELILTGKFHPTGPITTIEYSWSSASLSASGNAIFADVTLVAYINPTNGITPPNPGLLTITFEPLNGQPVNFDTAYPPDYDQHGTVIFTIDPVPEPGTLVHLTWLGIVGVGLLWRRGRSAARLSSEQLAVLRG
jgi:hypothetical protein